MYIGNEERPFFGILHPSVYSFLRRKSLQFRLQAVWHRREAELQTFPIRKVQTTFHMKCKDAHFSLAFFVESCHEGSQMIAWPETQFSKNLGILHLWVSVCETAERRNYKLRCQKLLNCFISTRPKVFRDFFLGRQPPQTADGHG